MPEPSPRPDKAAVLAKLLGAESPLCVACISAKSDVAVGEIAPIIGRLAQTIYVKRDIGGLCRGCERWSLVYSLTSESKAR